MIDMRTKQKDTMRVLTLRPMECKEESRFPTDSYIGTCGRRYVWNDIEHRYICREWHGLDDVLAVDMSWRDNIGKWEVAIYIDRIGVMTCDADVMYIEDVELPHERNAHSAIISNGRITLNAI